MENATEITHRQISEQTSKGFPSDKEHSVSHIPIHECQTCFRILHSLMLVNHGHQITSREKKNEVTEL